MKFSLYPISIFSLFNLLFSSVPSDSVVSKCSVTPKIENVRDFPNHMNLSNNLRRKTGSFESASGTNISIYGRLLDKNCLPVTDAIIEVWQTNSHGVYQEENEDESSDLGSNIDKHFIGSGTTSTNNMGQFHFITILPGSYKGSTPFINVSVTFPSLHNFKTKIYFNHRGRSIVDDAIESVPEAMRSLLLANPYNSNMKINHKIPHDKNNANDKIYIFDIVVEEKLVNKVY